MPQNDSELQRRDYSADLALAQAAARGEQVALRALMERLIDKVRNTAAYLKGFRADAEDLAQESLVQILRSVGSFRGDCSLEYWADRITVRTTMQDIRRFRRREQISLRVHEPDPEHRGTDELTDRRRIRRRMVELMGTISEERRTALVLHHVHGYRVSEIADMTKAPINTVRDRLNKGRRQLRALIAEDDDLHAWIEKGVA